MEEKLETVMDLILDNILDIIAFRGEELVRDNLSSFSSPQNKDIESFLKKNAIDFAKKKMSVTYILSDNDDGALLGYFTLAHKALEIQKDMISKSLARKIERYAVLDENNNSYTVSSYLLAQFGKNFAIDHGKRIGIYNMMNQVDNTVKQVQHMIGGGLIYLDVEKENDKVVNIYHSKTNYTTFNERVSKSTGKSYIMMIKAI